MCIGVKESWRFPIIYSRSYVRSTTIQHCKKIYPNINESIKKGDLSQTKSWLKENIWSNASIYSTDELMTKATGEALNPKYFKAHLENRYLL
ncbi:MAG: Thermostable carboxypeptidase 1 (EC [uncultured Campylobacterales bacterium]|uniref:Thermostable carboxypeptidase 1 (EC) n=1 Tax=uncultured Campylobacterales bacterium TaxID=352960 RepID=A0A6S6SAW8_9BACT|nr:MAG: Thermostable carboxypeptidase 1 (EC [uncultured Campylobacterales bacterium]